jgi:hypothetical protein
MGKRFEDGRIPLDEKGEIDLDQAIEIGLPRVGDDAEEEEPRSDDEDDPPPEAPGAEKKAAGDTPEGRAAGGDPDTPPSAGKTPAEPATPPAPGGAEPRRRFSTWDAAEDGYANLQADHTRRSQELAETKRRLAELESQASQRTLQDRIAEADAAVEKFATEKSAEAQQAIGAIGEDDPQRDAKIAGVWGRCYGAIASFRAGKDREIAAAPGKKTVDGVDPVDGVDGVGKAGAEAPEPPPAAAPPAPAAAAAPDPAAALRRVTDLLEAHNAGQPAGSTPLGLADPVFRGFALQAPRAGADGKAMDLAAQTRWAIEQTTKHYAAIRATSLQGARAPMGRHGQGREAAGGKTREPEATLGDAIEQAHSARRIA